MRHKNRVQVAGREDLATIEALGFDAFLPSKRPFDLLRESAKKFPDRVAIRYLSSESRSLPDITLTYADLLAKVIQAANLFRRLGAGRSDGIAILTPHIPYGQIAIWAAEIAGRAFPINPSLHPDHIASLIESANTKVAVVLGANGEVDIWGNTLAALRSAKGLETVLDVDSDGATPGSDGCFEALLAKEPSDRLTFADEPLPDDVAAYFHTGGTTGTPKLAQHSHRNQAFVARAAALMFDLTSSDVVVNGFPLFHVAGSFVYGLSVFSAGGSLLVPGRLGMRNQNFISTIWDHVALRGVTVIGAVPTIISTLITIPVQADISSLRLVLTGGSPLPVELADRFEQTVGRPVRSVFGMTESAGVVTIEPFHGPRLPGSTGFALPFTEVCAFPANESGIIDFKRPCKAGETGVLALRGPNVVAGYSDITLNRGTFEPDGWLVSGDLGCVDDNGRVFVNGRAKDVIIRGGHNIDPALIEEALLQHPAVANAAAVGQPDAYAGELPVAFVSLKPNCRLTESELLSFVRPRVAEPAAQPKRIWILAELPLTPVGKIFKPALRGISTREALANAINSVSVPDDTYRIELNAAGATILVDAAAPTEISDRIRRCLIGMPIKYEVVH